jgi:hypothetical protein
MCADVFGKAFDLKFIREAIADTNTNYGGFSYEGTRVVFVNGDIDPW